VDPHGLGDEERADEHEQERRAEGAERDLGRRQVEHHRQGRHDQRDRRGRQGLGQPPGDRQDHDRGQPRRHAVAIEPGHQAGEDRTGDQADGALAPLEGRAGQVDVDEIGLGRVVALHQPTLPRRQAQWVRRKSSVRSQATRASAGL
jgi:hypothetical protein